jgi:hypothetical protein
MCEYHHVHPLLFGERRRHFSWATVAISPVRACELPQYYPWSRPPFIKGSHRQILEWRPAPWLIPTHDELFDMESLLTVLQDSNSECAKMYEGVNFYFSATAICTVTLGKTPSVGKQLRSVTLREDCRGVENPEVDAEGLVSYCMEKYKLHILM